MFGYAPALAVFLEPMQMAIGPAYDGLEDVVETIQTEGIWNLDQSPDRRTNLPESDPKLVNAGLGLRFVGLRFRCYLHRCHLHGYRSAREAKASISRWGRPSQGNWLQKRGIRFGEAVPDGGSRHGARGAGLL